MKAANIGYCLKILTFGNTFQQYVYDYIAGIHKLFYSFNFNEPNNFLKHCKIIKAMHEYIGIV